VKVNETLVEFPVEPRTRTGPVNPDQLLIKVSGPEEVTASITTRGSESFVSFVTTTTGEYRISITHDGEDIIRSPVTVTVKTKGDTSSPASIPEEDDSADPSKHIVRFQVDSKDKLGNRISDTNFEGEIQGPEAISEIKIQPSDGRLLVSFETTVTSGDFVVSIRCHGDHIYRSPFTVSLSKPERGEAPNDDNIATLEPEDDSKTIQFKIDAFMPDGSAVKASELNVSIDHGPDLTWDPTVEDEESQLLVSFKTKTLGNYTVNVRKGNNNIRGSPFNLQM